jgi:Ni/Co efflux regulator RcnB
MRKLIFATLLGATLLPGTAIAQNRELWRDRQDIRQERRDLDRAYAYGDRHDIRDERGDYRDARREYREDVRDYRREGYRDWRRDDWRGYRDHNRDLYRGGNWRSEYRYQPYRPGVRLSVGVYGPRYYINDYGRYRLPQPGWGQRWIRHYNDVLLVDVRTGLVIDVYRNFYW